MIEPRIVDLMRAAKENSFIRKVLVTASKSQVVLISLLPGEEIGTEVHQGDQLLYTVKGKAVAVRRRSTPTGPSTRRRRTRNRLRRLGVALAAVCRRERHATAAEARSFPTGLLVSAR